MATGIGIGETIELIDKAVSAFAGQAAFQILIKCHPMISTDWISAELGDIVKFDNVSFTSDPICELLLDTHILLYTYTAVCFSFFATEPKKL